MDGREQRFVIRFFWLRGLGRKAIYAQPSGTLAESALCLSTVQWRLRRFKEGNTSYEETERFGIPMIAIGDILRKFLAKHLFGSAKNMSHSGVSAWTVKEILTRKLEFKEPFRRWIPHLLDVIKKSIVGYQQSSCLNWCASTSHLTSTALEPAMRLDSNITTSLKKCLSLHANKSVLMFELIRVFKK
jgi:hypothetical protein